MTPSLSPRLALVPGATLKHLGADPAQTYVASRDTQALRAAGAIDDEDAAVAAAIDGIDGAPADGRVQLVEIERGLAAASADRFDARSLSRLLDALAWQPVTPPSPAPFALPALAATDISVVPSAPTHVPVPFDAFPTSWGTLPAKVAAHDPSAAGSGVTLAAVRAAEANGWTRATHFEVLKRRVGAVLCERQGVTMSARARVPTPGRQTIALMHDGSTAASLIVETQIREEASHVANGDWRDRSVALKATRTTALEVMVPDGRRAAIIALPSGDEVVFEAGRHAPTLSAGSHRIALHAVDAPPGTPPLEVSEVEIPALGPPEELDLGAFVGFRLFGDDDVPLHRNLVATHVGGTLPRPPEDPHGPPWYVWRATYAWSTAPWPPEGVDLNVAYRTEPEPLPVPPGRYEVDFKLSRPLSELGNGERVIVDLFPEGIAKVWRGGQAVTLGPAVSRSYLAEGPAGGLNFHLSRAILRGQRLHRVRGREVLARAEATLTPDRRVAS
jgi:hypothetical protein